MISACDCIQPLAPLELVLGNSGCNAGWLRRLAYWRLCSLLCAWTFEATPLSPWWYTGCVRAMWSNDCQATWHVVAEKTVTATSHPQSVLPFCVAWSAHAVSTNGHVESGLNTRNEIESQQTSRTRCSPVQPKERHKCLRWSGLFKTASSGSWTWTWKWSEWNWSCFNPWSSEETFGRKVASELPRPCKLGGPCQCPALTNCKGG